MWRREGGGECCGLEIAGALALRTARNGAAAEDNSRDAAISCVVMAEAELGTVFRDRGKGGDRACVCVCVCATEKEREREREREIVCVCVCVSE